MRKIHVILLFVACTAQSKETFKFNLPEPATLEEMIEQGGWFVNRLRGYAVKISPRWDIVVAPSGFYIGDTDEGRYLARITFFKLPKDSLKVLWRRWIDELEQYVRGEIFLRDSGGIVHVLVSDMRFPTSLFLNSKVRGNFQGHFVFLEGKDWHRFVAMIYPKDAQEQKLEEFMEVVSTFKVLPASERVAYEVKGVPEDFPAYFLPVPQNYQLEGYKFPMGTLEECTYTLTSMDDPSIRFSRHVFNWHVEAVGGMGNAVFMVDGNIQAFVDIPRTAEDFLDVMLELWQEDWVLEKLWVDEVSYLKRDILRQLESVQSNLPFRSKPIAVVFVAKLSKDNLTRYVVVMGGGGEISQVSLFGSHYQGYMYSSVFIFQGPKDKEAEWSNLLFAVFKDAIPNPKWVTFVRQRNVRIQKAIDQWVNHRLNQIRQEGEMFRSMLYRNEGTQTFSMHDEFVSDMNEAWANILGENIYAKDPSTGEVFYLDDVGGNYLRNPETGDILMGVDPQSMDQLMNLGWKPLDLSYEPFD